MGLSSNGSIPHGMLWTDEKYAHVQLEQFWNTKMAICGCCAYDPVLELYAAEVLSWGLLSSVFLKVSHFL